ncbi:Ubiquitin-conjugating enzyme E2 J1 isoform 3 [Schistosoma japonicum]|uniref:Ubiquitin-conjugating enzyme E2 J1 n=3 Tax=Schistosoma japonicum TaxID=6182 RepID=C1LGT6_SCHJA|nr:Ubiquitin-conjugating enzyme E2 J1 isoform 3 [Schistosoma japonicum]CAX73914.1 Ubiquitin-conjugating enzyme E2 J1 [Schistosoma japonicum]
MPVTYNSRNPAVKRLMKEAQELSAPTELYFAKPLEDNLFEWHFTIRGPEDSDFQGGVYHGRILLPSEYPMKPPNIVLLTPNGRFETHRKICLSISGYHPESWRPSWSIRTALLALIGFMPTHGVGAIGSLNQPKEERQLLAFKSQSYVCSTCGPTSKLLLPLTSASSSMNKEASEVAAQMSMMSEEEIADKKGLAKSDTPTTNSNNNQSNSSFSSTPLLTTSSICPPFTNPSASSPVESSTVNIPENMNPYPWGRFPSYIYPNKNENATPQIAYWLCFPVYYHIPISYPLSSSLAAAGSNSVTSTNEERVPLSFSEWLKEIRKKEKIENTSDQYTASCSSTTQVIQMSCGNENNKSISSMKTLSEEINGSDEVISSSTEMQSEKQNCNIIPELFSALNKNKSIPEEKSSGSTNIPPEYAEISVETNIGLVKIDSHLMNNHESKVLPHSDGHLNGTSLEISDNNIDSSEMQNTNAVNMDKTIDKNTEHSESKSQICRTHQIQTDEICNRVVGRSMNISNGNRGHTRRSIQLDQYHTMAVCAVGVAVALFIIVLRRLAIILQDA